ncbi:hypothetical protein SSOG_01595 [Streptomyces himastatinicus ATCC 53653]|uniref:Uncharacterized protein n=1 Tax=Streptomyces himastatinicus ATCC 53653 TaxID=457427 RepID=D9WPL8_9ACTN|nr:hypothetical protein [Streptomyces himastatinicus]EFL21883.1 hypothetical protein SSOG_01595 [Streptomyces himastatinicus ATCC 53653]
MSASDQPTSPEEQLRAGIFAAVEEYKRAKRAADANHDQNTLDLDYVRWIADNYGASREDGSEELTSFLEELANELDLDEVRILRMAGEAAVAVTPRVIEGAAERGMKPPRIADEIGLTPSRVYGILREQRAKDERAVVDAFFSASRSNQKTDDQ